MILLQFSLSQNTIGFLMGIIGTITTCLVGILVWIFTQNRTETKSRIDARAIETNELFDKYSSIDKKVGQLESRVDAIETHNSRLDDTIRQNHSEITKRLDSIFELISKKH